eukprot:1735659-Heterocapsa_arctica.AAC.1
MCGPWVSPSAPLFPSRLPHLFAARLPGSTCAPWVHPVPSLQFPEWLRLGPLLCIVYSRAL